MGKRKKGEAKKRKGIRGSGAGENTSDRGYRRPERKIWRVKRGSEKNVKKIGKSLKKQLTFKWVYGIIFKLSQESSPIRYQGKRMSQKSSKKLKKVLKNS